MTSPRTGGSHRETLPPLPLTLTTYRGLMPMASITVTSVIDEGDQIVVRGVRSDGGEMAYAFLAKGPGGDPELAMRASRLSRGDVVDVDALEVVGGWHVVRRLASC